ncbi:MAG: hypothetical protein ACREAY_11900 [Nitrososphaera sp.]|uniref:hypothetical protein n=1 Tax=Nitrososphaera sp. TaxID=1971748 RepID=UPI003D6E0116
MADWKDLTVLLCMALVVLGAVALAVSAQSFSIVRGKVVEKGVGVLQHEGRPRLTNTVSVLIENDDRVFDIRRGTVVQYPVAERDSEAIVVGSEIELLVSSHRANVRILDGPSGSPV